MGRGWTGVGHSGGGWSILPGGRGGSLVELWVGGENAVYWGKIEFGEDMGKGT